MDAPPARTATVTRPAVALPGRWLGLAHAVVATVTVLALATAIVSGPWRFARLSTVCAADPCASGEFAGQKGQLGPAGARALREQGLSLGAYAAYVTALDLVRVAVGFAFAFVFV